MAGEHDFSAHRRGWLEERGDPTDAGVNREPRAGSRCQDVREHRRRTVAPTEAEAQAERNRAAGASFSQGGDSPRSTGTTKGTRGSGLEAESAGLAAKSLELPAVTPGTSDCIIWFT
ncbi:hypothetical protein NDU88_000759 [Pleurodeles waltl]|uniref:Uncharacterized protein n=1 Tax=Pleurodeles waltl TaxID=8319 RepID=A0AAV7URE0_PLEWA|nr:hypothetical protein NDU88_000759 [Pleurodeles waltl]